MLDDGRLTDGQGRTVDFRNVILILTSNLGSQFLANQTLDATMKRDAVMGVVRGAFKPEFLNRFDDAKAEVLAFTAFPRSHWYKIWSTNLIERLNREIKRRARVVGTSPTKPP